MITATGEAGGRAPLELRGVTKQFVAEGRLAHLRAAVPWRTRPRGPVALTDVDLRVDPGEVVGVVGSNGAGKTTLLKVAAGVLTPTGGTVEVAGRPAAMIELALPFHPELSGRENLPVVAALAGLSPGQFDDRVEEIVDFSGIGDHLDVAVKHYSTGMLARLGFALATSVPSPVLLVDEVLAVGDREFQQRCLERIRDRASEGTAVVLVSHSLGLIAQLCDRAIRLEAGAIVDRGAAIEVVDRYRNADDGRVPARTAMRIDHLRLGERLVATGDHLDVALTVDVDEPRPVQLRSEILVPGHGTAVVNEDLLAENAFDRPGRWTVATRVGPLNSTAAKLQFRVTLSAGGTGELEDRATTDFEIFGEDAGLVRMAMEAAWEELPAPPSESTPTPHPDSRRTGDGAVVSVTELTKRFGSRRARRAGAPAALAALDLDAGRGTCIGIIGGNGAGKSTLLRVIAGVSEPSAGSVVVDGSVVAVLELEAGFVGDLSGWENLGFLWQLHGGDAARLIDARPAIQAFADIGDVLDRPVKHYSTGMRARLALAIALELQPQVLLIDEALSVGDHRFRERVRERLRSMVAHGTTVLFASHDLHLLATICSRVIRLEGGRLVDDGDAAEVIARAGGAGWSGGSTRIGGAAVSPLNVTPDVLAFGEPFSVSFDLEVTEPSSAHVLELSVRQSLGSHERDLLRDPEHVLWNTLALRRLTGSESLFRSPGTRHVRIDCSGIPAVNSHDVVVSVIDTVEVTVQSEQWHTTFFGAEGERHARFETVWDVVEAPPS